MFGSHGTFVHSNSMPMESDEICTDLFSEEASNSYHNGIRAVKSNSLPGGRVDLTGYAGSLNAVWRSALESELPQNVSRNARK